VVIVVVIVVVVVVVVVVVQKKGTRTVQSSCEGALHWRYEGSWRRRKTRRTSTRRE